MAALPAVSRVRWAQTYCLTPARYPPIDLFERVGDPADWERLAALESRTDPRLREQWGEIAIVPPERRVSGPGASWVMAAFTHFSRARATRLSDGTYGVYYAARELETAVAEVAHHLGRFYAATDDSPHREDCRVLEGSIDARLHDVRGPGWEHVLAPDTYRESQDLARRLRDGGSGGVVYPSVRRPHGECFGAFWPDVVGLPSEIGHLALAWNGARVDRVFDYRTDTWSALP